MFIMFLVLKIEYLFQIPASEKYIMNILIKDTSMSRKHAPPTKNS